MVTNNSVNNKSSTFKTTAQTIDPGASGDSYVQYVIDGNEFRIGCDDSDADSFVISQGGSLGTNNVFHVETTGEINFPLQSTFLSVNTGIPQNNVTGNGATATGQYDLIVFDPQANFSTPTFTASQTGRYLFDYGIQLQNITAPATTGNLILVTSNRDYVTFKGGYGPLRETSGGFDQILSQSSSYADMDAADTAIVTCQVSGMAGNTVDIGDNAAENFFSGSLMC